MLKGKIIENSNLISEIDFDSKLFSDILNCLDNARKEHIPDLCWKELGGWKGNADQQYNAKEMMFHWVGYAKNFITKKDLFWWYESLLEIDHLNLLDKLKCVCRR